MRPSSIKSTVEQASSRDAGFFQSQDAPELPHMCQACCSCSCSANQVLAQLAKLVRRILLEERNRGNQLSSLKFRVPSQTSWRNWRVVSENLLVSCSVTSQVPVLAGLKYWEYETYTGQPLCNLCTAHHLYPGTSTTLLSCQFQSTIVVIGGVLLSRLSTDTASDKRVQVHLRARTA